MSIGYAGLALSLPEHPAPGPGPAFLPLVIAGALFAVAVSFVTEGWRLRKATRADTGGRERLDSGTLAAVTSDTAAVSGRKSLIVILLCTAYVPAFYVLGFVVSTAALSMLLARLFGEARLSVLAALGIAVPLLLLAVFGAGLGVRFPILPPAF